MTTLLDFLLKKYPDKPWDISILQEQEELPSWYIKERINYNWDFYNKLSKIDHVVVDLILEFPNKEWNLDYICQFNTHPKFLQIVFDNPEYKNYYNKTWNYNRLTKNKLISMDIIQNNPQIKWDFFEITGKIDLTNKLHLDFLINNYDKDWNKQELTNLNNLTIDFIIEHPELPWSGNIITKKFVNIFTISTIKKLVDIGIDDICWTTVLKNTGNNYTLEDLLDNFRDQIEFCHTLQKHPELNFLIIDKYNLKNLDWMQVTQTILNNYKENKQLLEKLKNNKNEIL